jgi:hypothetical protein
MTDLMTRLQTADPVAEPPDAPALDALLGNRLENDPGLAPAPRRPRRRRLVLAPVLAAAIVALVLGLSAGSSSPDVLAEAQEALGPQGGILHYVIRRPEAGPENAKVEVWVTRDPRRERMQIGEDGLTLRSQYADGEIRHVMRGDDHVTVNRMSPQGRREFEDGEPSPLGTGLDPLTGVRRMLDDGKLREDGKAELDGREVIRLVGTEPARPAPGGATRPTVDHEYYVDAETFAPVRLIDRWHQRSGTATTDFEVYERLPLTPENERLLELPGIDGMREVDPNR